MFSVLGDRANCLQFMREHGLLSRGMCCETCKQHAGMRVIQDTKRGDGERWRCPTCGTCKSIRHGSFFSGQRLPLQILMSVLYMFAYRVSPTTALAMLQTGADAGEQTICRTSVLAWYNLYRDLMSKDMVRNQLKLGGPGKHVEVDESLWSRKRKYNRGRVSPEKPWIFGAVERENGKVVLFTLANRTKEKLIHKISTVVLPQTSIFTDDWASYRTLNTKGYQHATVNHSENFVDPATGAHTQTIEGFWGHAKLTMKLMHGTSDNMLPAYLDEIA